MLRVFVWAALALCLSFEVYAQRPAVIAVEPHVSVGDVWQLELTKERTRFDVQGGPAKGSAKSELTIRVLEVSDAGVAVSMTYGSATELHGAAVPQGAGEDLANRLSETFGRTPILLELSLEFEPKRIRNLPELKKQALQALGMIAEAGGMKSADREKMQQLFADDSFISELILGSVAPFFSVVGGSYEVGTFGPEDGEMPNPLGGEPLKSTVSGTVMFVDASSQVLRIEIFQKIAKSSVQGMVDSLASRMGSRLTDAERAEMQEALKNFDASVTSLYEVPVSEGLPRLVKITKSTSIGKDRQITVETMRRLR